LTLRQAWELDDAAKAEKLIRYLAHRLEHDTPGVSGSLAARMLRQLPRETCRRFLSKSTIVESSKSLSQAAIA
jgi:hypothetical protein